MARIRSPNYPQISLPAALEKVGVIFDKAHHHSLEKEDIAKLLGYTGQSGSFLGAVSALLKYGLLDQSGSSFRVSKPAVAILHPSSDSEKRSALQTALGAPALFAEILSEFSDKLPSDEYLRSYLVRRGFAQSAVSSVISVLRDSLDMVAAEGGSVPGISGRGSLAVSEAPATVSGTGIVRPAEIRPSADFQPQITVAWEGNILRVSAVLKDQFMTSRLIQLLNANMPLLPVLPEGDELAASVSAVPVGA